MILYPSLEELEKLRDLAIKYDLFLVADEVYREFVYEGIKHHSIMSLQGTAIEISDSSFGSK